MKNKKPKVGDRQKYHVATCAITFLVVDVKHGVVTQICTWCAANVPLNYEMAHTYYHFITNTYIDDTTDAGQLHHDLQRLHIKDVAGIKENMLRPKTQASI